ncbi:baseplate J/gp47 family protein [Deinococcus sp. 6YEL10]|uniref:baseplate J/gp47 family protein n=1 Tax=Deinococcus sp. 6YEL10 TaxID=2745870 RepID=UPI001E4BB610|nr:baseplate J/gp47 family protein [Deinococcus sp. 6YEL10]MCD0159766.1 baseplate J/gp47 family protein [Deinococcus sp. 6YEL10]
MSDLDFGLDLDTRSVDTIFASMRDAAIGVAPTMTDDDPADPAMLLLASLTAELRGQQLTLNLFRRKFRERLYQMHGGEMLDATRARVWLVFTCTLQRTEDVVIDERIMVSNQDGSVTYQVRRALTPVRIPPNNAGDEKDPDGRYLYLVEAEAVEPGTGSRVQVGTLTRMVNAPAGAIEVTNPYASTGGTDAETPDEAEARLAAKFTSAGPVVRRVDFYEKARLSNREIHDGKVFVEPLLKVIPMQVTLTVRRGAVNGQYPAYTVAPGLILSDTGGRRTYSIRSALNFPDGVSELTGVTAYARNERLSFAVAPDELHQIVNGNFPGSDLLSFSHGYSDPAPAGATDAQGKPLNDYWRFLRYDPEGNLNVGPNGQPLGATLEPAGHVTVLVIPADGGVAEEQHLMDVEYAYGGAGPTEARTLPGMLHSGVAGERQVHVISHRPRPLKPRVEVYKRRGVSDELVTSQVTAALDAFLNPVTGGPDGTGWEGAAEILPYDFYPSVRAVPGVTRVRSITLPEETLNLNGAVALSAYEFPASPAPDYMGRKYDILVALDPKEA